MITVRTIISASRSRTATDPTAIAITVDCSRPTSFAFTAIDVFSPTLVACIVVVEAAAVVGTEPVVELALQPISDAHYALVI